MKATTSNKPSVLAQSFATLLSSNFSEFPNFEKATPKDLEYYFEVLTKEIETLHTDIVLPMRDFREKLKQTRNELKKLVRSAEKPAKEKKERTPKANKNDKSEVVGYLLTKSEATGREWKTPVTKAQLAKQPELAEKLVSEEQVNKELAKRGEEMKAEAASKTKAVPKPTAKPVKQAAAVAEKKVAYKSTAAKTAPKKATTKKSSN